MLVAMGASLFVLVPERMGMDQQAMSRILQGLLAGVGFLGAGSIIKGSRGEEVKGLTTAASIWVAAAIGVACGLGRESSAVVSTLMALLILYAVPRFAALFEGKPANREGSALPRAPSHAGPEQQRHRDADREAGEMRPPRDGAE
jgi:putative Mg2+ transporter-C (MgtC) family protein